MHPPRKVLVASLSERAEGPLGTAPYRELSPFLVGGGFHQQCLLAWPAGWQMWVGTLQDTLMAEPEPPTHRGGAECSSCRSSVSTTGARPPFRSAVPTYHSGPFLRYILPTPVFFQIPSPLRWSHVRIFWVSGSDSEPTARLGLRLAGGLFLSPEVPVPHTPPCLQAIA